MIRFIGTLVTFSYSHLNTALPLIDTLANSPLQALGLSVFTRRLLATDLNRETITSSLYEVFLSVRLQVPWNLGTQLKILLDCILCQSQSHIATDGQSVSLGSEPNMELMIRYLLLFDS
jgi:hypothetical protein